MDRKTKNKALDDLKNKFPSEVMENYIINDDNGNFDKTKKSRKKKKKNYKKIKNNIRKMLVDMVKIKGIPLKNAAHNLGINYSTAKSIFRIYKLENRVIKKNTFDENELKNVYYTIKEKQKHKSIVNQKILDISKLFYNLAPPINPIKSINLNILMDNLNDKIKNLQNNVNECYDLIMKNNIKIQNYFPCLIVENPFPPLFNIKSKNIILNRIKKL